MNDGTQTIAMRAAAISALVKALSEKLAADPDIVSEAVMGVVAEDANTAFDNITEGGKHLQRIESKLDFLLRQQARKESVPLAPTAYSALAQAGMDPRDLQTHKVVTLLDDWKAERHANKGCAPTCHVCKKDLEYDDWEWMCTNPECKQDKEDGDEQR